MVSYKKVTKPTARKLFNSGTPVYLLPSKVNAFMVFDNNYKGFIQPVVISYKEDRGENQFDRTVNEFEYYNCNSEMGYYAHYFIKEQEETKHEVKE